MNAVSSVETLLLTGKTATSGANVAVKEQRVSANDLSPNRIHTDKSHPLHYWSWRRKSTTAWGGVITVCVWGGQKDASPPLVRL